MKEKLLLASVLAFGGCAAPKPSPTLEPTPTKDPRVVDMVDCREGPFAVETIVSVPGEYVSFAARRASDHEQIRIKIVPQEDRRYGITPENTNITGLKQPRTGLLEFNASGIFFTIDGRHSQTGEFFVAASAECIEVNPVEPNPLS